MMAANQGQDLNISDSQNYSMNTTTRTQMDKRVMKINFLELENKNMLQMIEDLQTTLKINKGIIKNLLDQKKGLNQMVEYTFNQLNHENELLENKLKRTIEDRD
jgi:DNA repair exonuclease SbcCD ATPase subunit